MENDKKKHEGRKLKEALEEAGKSNSDLALAAKFTPTSIGRYVKLEKIHDKAWPHLADGLRKLGIDPGQIRPSDQGSVGMVSIDEVIQVVDMFTPKQLDALLYILSADEGHKLAIRSVVTDRIHTRR